MSSHQPIQSLPNERWKPFKTNELNKKPRGSAIAYKYARSDWWVSDHGRVKFATYYYTREEMQHTAFKQLTRAGETEWKLMPEYLKGGHEKTGKYSCLPTQEYIHRLVAQAFIPNPEGKRTVNHKDLNKQNNHVSNLEWATYGENLKHSWQNGRTNNSKGRVKGTCKNYKQK